MHESVSWVPSVFCHCTVSPTSTVMFCGTNSKFVSVTKWVTAAIDSSRRVVIPGPLAT